ncbi:hypothetical protein KBZ10_02895 [Streptomyces sp. F63]|nr:hypothetical protein [Streptomyces sp. F63]MBQ0983496.1 hypothetical protein [Streptomyces sp. F63]
MPDGIRDPDCSNARTEAADESVRDTAMLDLGRAPAEPVSRIAEWLTERA